ncbi:MAG: hypothetical protein SFY80_16750 [Verrucomicrobiota bacterium]|nr:hypothetical protein [Verrucomicrobiota bacterium]
MENIPSTTCNKTEIFPYIKLFGKEMILLFKVEDRFQLTGRGCVLVPGIPHEPSLPIVRVSDKIMLTRPDGSKILTHIASIEMVNYHTKPQKVAVPICLPSEFSTEDIPKGTEVFLIQKEEPNQALQPTAPSRRV